MTKDKAKLEEVKAILHELQRIRPDLASLDKAPQSQPQPVRPAPPPAVNGAGRTQPPHEHVAAANAASAPQRPDATASAGGTNRRALVVGAGFVVVASAAVGALFLLNQPPKTIKAPDQVAAISPAAAPAPPSPASPAPSENPPAADSRLALLQQGQKLMSEGDIKGAREALLQPAESGYPDAAFSLARSYDPNFLQSVANPNAGPDIAQAELWYRRWHEAAVKAGVVTDSLRLERILQSMH